MLKRKTALIVLSVVLLFALVAVAALAMVVSPSENNNTVASTADNTASAAITAATSFDKFPAGTQYRFSTAAGTTGTTTITTTTTDTYGSQKNPYVIRTKEQWILFVNKTATTETAYNSASAYYVVAADINFGGNTIDPAGFYNGFKGKLYGCRHTFSNAKIQWKANPSIVNYLHSGLFSHIIGGHVYDLKLASNITLTMDAAATDRTYVYLGGLVSWTNNSATLVNIDSNVSISYTCTATTEKLPRVGGLVGIAYTTYIYKCSYNGNLSATNMANAPSANNRWAMGGLIGYHGSGKLIVDTVSVKGNITSGTSTTPGTGGVMAGGLIGYPSANWKTTVVQIQNVLLNVNITIQGEGNHIDCGLIFGEETGTGNNLTKEDGDVDSYVKNVYIVGGSFNAKKTDGTAVYTNSMNIVGMEQGMAQAGYNSWYSGIYLPVATTATLVPAKINAMTSGLVTKSGSAANVVTAANSNTNLKNAFTISTSGGVNKNYSSFLVNYSLVGGSWSATSKTTSYSTKTTAQDLLSITSSAVNPTRTGFTFAGWATTPRGTSITQIPANQTGDLTLYAKWTCSNALTGSAMTAQTVTYGATSVSLDGSGFGHAAGSNVKLTYQWQDTAGANISGATANKYTISNPKVAQSGTYKLVIKITPQDGFTPAVTAAAQSVKLTVNRLGVTAPTATTPQTYTGKVLTGLSTTNANITIGGTPTATAAGSYKATAALKDKDNLCWGSSGGTTTADKEYTWVINKATVAVPSITAGASQVYTGSALTPTVSAASGTTTVTNTAQTNVGTYTVTVALKDTANYQWKTAPSGGTVTSNYSLSWQITKATVAVPSMTAGSSQVYTGSALTPTISAASGTTTVTNPSKTDVGTYTVTVALKDTKNYQWKTAPSGGTVTSNYTFTWSITKANVTVTAPTFTSNSVDGKVYVGQTLANLTLTGGTHVSAQTNANVPGTFTWTSATTTKVAATSKSFGVTFTPTDTKNYNTATATVSVSPTQLYLNVRELAIEFLDSSNTVVDLDGIDLSNTSDPNYVTNLAKARKITNLRRVAKTAVALPVDYNTQFTLANLNVAKGTKVNTVALNFQHPVGYTMAYYKDMDGNNNGTNAYTATKTDAITANLTVYVGYVAQDVNYKVVVVKQALVADDTPSTSDLLNNLAALVTANKVEVTNKTAKAGTIVSYPATDIPGFTRVANLPANGNKTYVTDDQSKFVLGSGDTMLVTYYQRNTYSVSWFFKDGTSQTIAASPADVYNEYTYSFKFGATFINISNPSYANHTFGGWYTDSACTKAFTAPASMPAQDLSLYAKRAAVEYTLRFDYNTVQLVQSLMGNAMSQLQPEFLNTLSPADPQANGRATYTIEDILTSTSIRLGTPTMLGFKFDGWVYYEDSDVNHTHPIKLSAITRSNAGSYNLYATWSQSAYYVSINAQGGRVTGGTSVRINNLDVYPASLFDNSRPITRSGYEFRYWAYTPTGTDDNGNSTEIGPETFYNFIKHGVTIYAIWKPVPVRVIWDEDVDTTLLESAIISTVIDGEQVNVTPNDTLNYNLLFLDSEIRLTLTPSEGIEITRIYLSGTNYSNGSVYRVRSYPNNELIIKVTTAYKNYNVTYDFNGGKYAGDTVYNRVFSLNPEKEFQVFGGSNISRAGYDFDGWRIEGVPLYGVNSDEDWTIIGEKDNNNTGYPVSGLSVAKTFGATNVTLIAEWTPAYRTLNYNNNFSSGGAAPVTTTHPLPQEVYTGNRFVLDPTFEAFTPDDDREIMGWSTFPSGEINYTVGYKYVDGEIRAQDVEYTVPETVEKEITLYAVWRIKNAQFTAIEADNNNVTFSMDAAYTGVTLTARPKYTYTRNSALNLVFTWYKVDSGWDTWKQEDIDNAANETAAAQAEANIGMHKIPMGAVPIRTSPALTDVAGEAQKDTYNFRNVADSGLYIVKLTATGTYTNSDGVEVTSTVEMYGEYNVAINPAQLEKIQLIGHTKDQSVPYTGAAQGLKATVPATYPYDAATDTYALPDGSKLKVNYTYFDVNKVQVGPNGEFIGGTPNAINVGEYRVEASFTFENSKGNYKTPATLNAQFVIAPIKITNVHFALQTLVSDVWTNVSGMDNNVYSANPFRIVATSTDILAQDENDVVIGMYYNGGDLVDGNVVNVGNYTAYCDNLTGTAADNYILATGNANQAFSIIKANHSINITLADGSTVYNGSHQELAAPVITNTANGSNVTIVRDEGLDVDLITADGCTLMLVYEIEAKYASDNFSPDLNKEPFETARGAVHAGTYTITIRVEESDPANELNYNAIEDITATLIIRQADYLGNGTDIGLSDAQLNRYLDNDQPNPNGFGDNHIVDFDTGVSYKPVLNLDSTKFKADYAYYMQDSDRNWNLINGINGVSKAGTYKVEAEITYVDAQYANDYKPVATQSVQLDITPGVIDEITANYKQDDENYLYGGSFNFNAMNGDEYKVKITVTYKTKDGKPAGSEVVDNLDVQFLDESGEAFTAFDRATRTGSTGGQLIDGEKGDYKIKAVVYGDMKKAPTFEVKVNQAELEDKNVAFDGSKDSNLTKVSATQWKYEYTYDGENHKPVLAGADSTFNIVGITPNDLKKGDITAAFTYTDGTNIGVAMPDEGFSTVGMRNITVTFTNNNKNYKALTNTTITCVYNVKAYQLTSEDIIWQYSNTNFNDAEHIETLEGNAKLRYQGERGYYVRAVYRNLAVTDASADNYYLPVGQIKIGNNAASAAIKVVDAGDYTITIANHKFAAAGDTPEEAENYEKTGTVQAELTIDPCEVIINWKLAEGLTSLTYNGQDQLKGGNVVATYASLDSTEPIKVSLAVDNAEDKTFVNAGTYTIKGSIEDSNYVAINPEYSVTIHPLVVEQIVKNEDGSVVSGNSEISWWYVGEGNKLEKIEDKDFSIAYKGAEYLLVVKYTVQDGDAGADVVDGMRTEAVVAASPIRDAGDYVVSTEYEDGNYDLSALTHKFKVTPLEVEVVWDQETVAYTYNAKMQSITATVTGIGDELGESIIDVADNEFRNANVGAGKYTAVVTVKGEYAHNYTLKGANDEGEVTREWSIAPIGITVEWDVDDLVYNDGYTLNEWGASVSNRQTNEEGVEDNVTMTYVIRNAEGAIVTEGFTVAGEYTVEIASVSDSNYSIAGVARKEVSVKRAVPQISNVNYTEYAESQDNNVTYVNNPTKLRNEKLTYESVSPISGNAVKGTLKFVEDADLSRLGRWNYDLVFTPEDVENYEEVALSLGITVLEDKIDHVGFDANRRQLNFSVGQELDPSPIKIYFEYNSYYEESVNGVIVQYGRKSGQIDKNNAANNVRFYLSNEDADVRITTTYIFKDSDVGERDLLVYATGDGEVREGRISITIVKSLPTKLIVENKADIEAGEYFVGNVFDKTKAVFHVKYDDSEADGVIDSAAIEMQNGELTAPADKQTITFIYKVGSVEVRDTVNVRVQPKIVVNVRFVDATYRWTEEGVVLTITTETGDALPEGISYTFYNAKDGMPAYLTMPAGQTEIVYDLEARFSVDSSRYAEIEPVTATITLRVIVADVDNSELRGPWARDAEALSTTSKEYTGEAMAAADYSLRNIKIVDNNEGSSSNYITSASYTINNAPDGSVSILEAGTYTIKATIDVTEINTGATFKIDRIYTIVITKAENVISNLSVANWIYGRDASEPVCIRAFGEPEYHYEGIEGTNYHSTIKPSQPGNYKVTATIFGTSSYSEVERSATFTIMQPEMIANGSNGQPVKGESDKNVVTVTGADGKGVVPGYGLKVEVIEDQAKLEGIKAKDSQFKKQVVLGGYDLQVVDASGEEVKDPGKYTVKILLTAEQRNAKNLKLYSVDEYGVAKEISISAPDKDGYISFETSEFGNEFVLSAKDVAAAKKTGWIIGLAAGGGVVMILVIVLVVVIIKKRRERD